MKYRSGSKIRTLFRRHNRIKPCFNSRIYLQSYCLHSVWVETVWRDRSVAGQWPRHLCPRVLGGLGPQLGQAPSRNPRQQTRQDYLCRINLQSQDTFIDWKNTAVVCWSRSGPVAGLGCEISFRQIHWQVPLRSVLLKKYRQQTSYSWTVWQAVGSSECST